MLSSEFIERQRPSLQAFLRAVTDGKGYVYEEITRPFYLFVVGTIVVFLLFLMRIVIPFPYTPILFETTMVVSLLAILVMLIGAGCSYSLMKRTSFRGCRRDWLSTALSYLDAKESGVIDVGRFKASPRPPRQFAFFHSAGPGASAILLRRMQSVDGQWSYPVVELEASKNQMVLMRVLAAFVLLALFVMLSLALIIPGAQIPVALLAVLVCGYLFYTYLGVRNRLKRARSDVSVRSDTGPPDIVARVFPLLREDYAYPLRLLTVREHGDLVYTGRAYTTTSGVRFMEAVFIPSVSQVQ